MKNTLAAITLMAVCLAATAQTVVPMPSDYEAATGVFSPKSSAVYLAPGSSADSALVMQWLSEVMADPVATTRRDDAAVRISVVPGTTADAEGYRLEVHPDSIVLQAGTHKGVVYGLQTLRQMAVDGPIDCCRISDAPAYSWRSYLLDESRHFFGEEAVKKIIDKLSELKINTLHWHLTDGAGWRLEVPGYPLLTERGSKIDYSHRFVTPEQWDSIYPGRKAYYDAQEIRRICDYAAARAVRIVPEIEMPGHSLAAISAYPALGSSTPAAGKPVTGDLLNAASPGVEGFLTDVLDYVADIFQPEYIHIGGDECDYSHWKNNDTIAAYMAAEGISEPWQLQYRLVHRMARHLASKGIRTIGWNEITGHDDTPAPEVEGLTAQFWEGDVSKIGRAASLGYEVVNSNQLYTYLDYTYEGIPLWKAYRLAPRPDGLSDSVAAQIKGVGAQMWTEHVPDFERLCHQTFPRLAAIAESAWTPESRRGYSSFMRRMQPLQGRWRAEGILVDQPVYTPGDAASTVPAERKTPANEFAGE